MKLNEKILQCRKRAGMSQEELARLLNTSRQAVSQWELGNAQPEVQNIIALAKIFGVTTDWLLLETEDAADAPQPEQQPQPEPPQYHARPDYANPSYESRNDDWVDHLPQMILRLIRRYGWLCGVYIAVSGLLFALVGGIAVAGSTAMVNTFSSSMVTEFSAFTGGDWNTLYDESGAVITDPAIYEALGLSAPSAASLTVSNPVALVGGLIVVIGVLVAIAGTVLAVVLKRRADQHP